MTHRSRSARRHGTPCPVYFNSLSPVVILLILFGPRVLPSPNSTQQEIDRQNITDLYCPRTFAMSKLLCPAAKKPRIRVDLACFASWRRHTNYSPPGAAGAERVVKKLPHCGACAFRAHAAAATASPGQPIRAAQQPQESASNSLVLPRFFASKALQRPCTTRSKDGGTASAQFGGPVATIARGGGLAVRRRRRGGQGYLGES